MFPYLTNKTIIVGKAEEEVLSFDAVIGNSTINTSAVSSLASVDLTKRSEFVIRDLDGEEKIQISGVSGDGAVYLDSPITRNYSVNRKASILVPGVLCTPLSSDLDTRLFNLSVSPVQEQDSASMKYANGDYGRSESTQGSRTVEISFSEKLAVKKSVGTGARVNVNGITGTGSIKTVVANPPSGASGTGYVPGDLLQVTFTGGLNGLIRVLTVGPAGNVLTYDTTPVNGGSGAYAVTGSAATSNVFDIPNYSKFLKAAGHTVYWYNWGEGVGFRSLAKADEDTVSFAVYQIQGGASPKAKKWLFTGCKCSSFDVGAEGVGKPYIANYKFTGKFYSVSTDDPISLTSCETGKAEKMLCNKIYTYDPITASTVNLSVSSVKLDAGLKTVGVPDPSDCNTGYAFYMITDREPKFTCDPLMKSLTDETLEANINNAELVAVSVKSSATSPNITIDMPTCQLGTAEQADKDGQIINNRTYQCLRNNQGAGSHNTSLPAECTYEILMGSRT